MYQVGALETRNDKKWRAEVPKGLDWGQMTEVRENKITQGQIAGNTKEIAGNTKESNKKWCQEKSPGLSMAARILVRLTLGREKLEDQGQ